MAIYYRKSLEKFALAQSAYIFETSKKGIEFYEEFFGHPFPFEKWDSVYCPEFTVGAMENPGVITYNDLLIFREERPPVSQISVSVDVILHEMAHMWFGNYVTMDWWDGLWLNESFADFVNYVCLDGIQGNLSFPTESAWLMMNSRKNWGYKEDANRATHPIACDVPDTKRAESIFDGITYSKGAAVMKQLYYLVGDRQFRENIKNYFEEFKWGNASLEDLLRHLENGAEDLDLKEWNRQWIETAGTNTIRVEWDPKVTGKQKVTLKQGALLAEHPTLRRHRLDLGFYKENGKLEKVVTVDLLPQSETVIELDNLGYCAVLPNHGDWAFISVELDTVSREYFVNNLPLLEDDLAKMLIIRSVYNDVRAAKVRGDSFVHLLLPYFKDNLGNPSIVKQLGEYCLSALTFVPPSLIDPIKIQMFETLWDLIQNVDQKDVLSEMKKLLISTIARPEDLLKMYSAFQKQGPLGERLSFTEGDHASLLFLMIAMEGVDSSQKEACRGEFLREDALPESLQKMKLMVETFSMSEEERERVWKEEVLNKSRSRSFVDLRYLLNGMGSKFNSQESRRKMLSKYFEVLPEVIQREESKIAETFLHAGKPFWENYEEVKKGLEKTLESIKPFGNELFDNSINKMIDE